MAMPTVSQNLYSVGDTVSIYVAIPTLEDPEIVNTISSAFANARLPQQVFIGVAFMTSSEFFEEYSEETDRVHPNVSSAWFNPRMHKGVGIGRRNAKFAYNGQDYFLQVDSHTNFEQDWDAFLLAVHNNAIFESGRNKVILTAYLGKYSMQGGVRRVIDRTTRYPFFTENDDFYSRAGFTLWQSFPLAEKLHIHNPFVPANKFNANFAFGDERFAKSNALPDSASFYDEEIIQTINLRDEGFSLVFPNVDMPLTHLYAYYQSKWSKRQHIEDIDPQAFEKMRDSYADFVNDPENMSKCVDYMDYAQYDPWSNWFDPMFIPTAY
jgi:hypothetical protein